MYNRSFCFRKREVSATITGEKRGKGIIVKLVEKQFDSVFPIIAFSFPIQRALNRKEGKISMINEENLTVRSQDLEESYHDAGQFYWCKTQELLKSKKLLTANTGGIVISELEAQDIDTETDWKLAEIKHQLAK